jgi:hypothetical protein
VTPARLRQGAGTVTRMPADDDAAGCPPVPGLALLRVRPPVRSLHVHASIRTRIRQHQARKVTLRPQPTGDDEADATHHGDDCDHAGEPVHLR